MTLQHEERRSTIIEPLTEVTLHEAMDGHAVEVACESRVESTREHT